MDINLNIKIKAGKRTPPQVTIYSTSITREKVIEFANGERVTETEICNWLEKGLTGALQKVADKPKEVKSFSTDNRTYED